MPAFAQDWAGTWEGSLENFPQTKGAEKISVTMELGPVPTQNGDCAVHRTTYRAGSVVRQVKDYRLCRGKAADEFYVDEGDGVRLTARMLNGVLYSAFKVDSALLVTSLRLAGDVLEEEIISMPDQPASTGIENLLVRSVQRLVVRRRR